jgi:hypothetical protein
LPIFILALVYTREDAGDKTVQNSFGMFWADVLDVVELPYQEDLAMNLTERLSNLTTTPSYPLVI